MGTEGTEVEAARAQFRAAATLTTPWSRLWRAFSQDHEYGEVTETVREVLRESSTVLASHETLFTCPKTRKSRSCSINLSMFNQSFQAPGVSFVVCDSVKGAGVDSFFLQRAWTCKSSKTFGSSKIMM